MSPPIEPGVLALFRLFVALEILLLLLRMALEASFRADFPLVGSPWAGLLWLTLSLAYLSWSRLGAWLGALYLPLGVFFSAAVTLGSAAAAMRARLEVGLRAEELVRSWWLGIVLLVVPLVVVAWQYGLRWVLGFCALTTAADLALTLPFAGGNRRLVLTLGFGLDGMLERARTIGGELGVEAGPGTGTAVRLTVRRGR